MSQSVREALRYLPDVVHAVAHRGEWPPSWGATFACASVRGVVAKAMADAGVPDWYDGKRGGRDQVRRGLTEARQELTARALAHYSGTPRLEASYPDGRPMRRHALTVTALNAAVKGTVADVSLPAAPASPLAGEGHADTALDVPPLPEGARPAAKPKPGEKVQTARSRSDLELAKFGGYLADIKSGERHGRRPRGWKQSPYQRMIAAGAPERDSMDVCIMWEAYPDWGLIAERYGVALVRSAMERYRDAWGRVEPWLTGSGAKPACAHCGTPFTASGRRRYCSETCKTRAKRARAK